MSRTLNPQIQTVTNVVVTCACGMLPLAKAQHRDANAAYAAMVEHYNLNPTLCQPSMHPVTVPLALSA